MATRNYHATIVQESYDTFGNVHSTLRIVAIVIHQGGKTLLFMQTQSTPQGGGATDVVNTGTRICVRTGLEGPFTCEPLTPPGPLTALMDLSPEAMVTQLHHAATATLVGDSTVAGQRAHRFRVRARQVIQGGMDGPATDTETGALYTAIGTNLPISETVQRTVVSNRTEIAQTTITWSNWDDPHLSIPAAPAS